MKCVGVALASAVAVTLHGCGGGGTTTPPGPASHTTAPPATNTTAPPATNTTAPPAPNTTAPPAPTTTAMPEPSPVPSGPDGQFSGPDAAKYLNQRYMAWNPTDDSSNLGVTISMTGDGNFVFYCSKNGTGCFNGNADCRISAAIANHRVMITKTGGFAGVMDRAQGMVFNQTTVENQLSKCSYVYDGATNNRLNYGCGCGALGGNDCDDIMCAFHNNDCAQDNFNRQECTDACNANTSACLKANPTTQNVETCYCNSPHLSEGYNQDSTLVSQCYFKAPNFYNGTHTDETRDMLKRRVVSQFTAPVDEVINEATGQTRYKPEYWTEVVLDAMVMFDILNTKPAHAIVAFIYDKAIPAGRVNAQSLAHQMQTNYGMQEPVPIVAFDKTVNVTETPPFSFESGDVTSIVV